MTGGSQRTESRRIFAAIGNLDGVHLGHRFLLRETARFADEEDAAPGAVFFDPHPRRHFRPDDPPFLITSPARRTNLIQSALRESVDGPLDDPNVVALTFDQVMASMTPEVFVKSVLKEQLGLAGVVTGSEFRFGAGRSGDAAALKALCTEAGLAMKIIDPLPDPDATEKFSSSAIREAIHAGDMVAAARMLGAPWIVDGVVVEGQKLGRTLGFPTANLLLGDLIAPKAGVYAVVGTVEGATYPGVANYGRRPTVGAPAPLLEVHLFDFEGDLYGKNLDVAFIDFLREERKFDGLDALKAQIAKDSEQARKILADF